MFDAKRKKFLAEIWRLSESRCWWQVKVVSSRQWVSTVGRLLCGKTCSKSGGKVEAKKTKRKYRCVTFINSTYKPLTRLVFWTGPLVYILYLHQGGVWEERGGPTRLPKRSIVPMLRLPCGCVTLTQNCRSPCAHHRIILFPIRRPGGIGEWWIAGRQRGQSSRVSVRRQLETSSPRPGRTGRARHRIALVPPAPAAAAGERGPAAGPRGLRWKGACAADRTASHWASRLDNVKKCW